MSTCWAPYSLGLSLHVPHLNINKFYEIITIVIFILQTRFRDDPFAPDHTNYKEAKPDYKLRFDSKPMLYLVCYNKNQPLWKFIHGPAT